MPHYADGSLAQLGDKVKGKPYNTDHEVVGEIIRITPNTESCNCVVAFVDVFQLSQEAAVAAQRFAAPNAIFNSDVQFGLLARYDYGETKAFAKL